MSGERAGSETEISFCKLCVRRASVRGTGQRVRAARRQELILRLTQVIPVPHLIRLFSSLSLRKQILKFLDAEKDISVLKGTLKPGDIIHYVFDRDSTMNVSQNLYELLPRTSPLKGKQFPTCAIVGNSGVLLSSGCGPEIDAHSFVIRYKGTAPCSTARPRGPQGLWSSARGWNPGHLGQHGLTAPQSSLMQMSCCKPFHSSISKCSPRVLASAPRLFSWCTINPPQPPLPSGLPSCKQTQPHPRLSQT